MFLDCQEDLARYHRRLAKKNGIDLVPQRHDSHISIIRTEELEVDRILSLYPYNGQVVEFCGNPEYMQSNNSHYWFRIISPHLEEIRTGLGFCSQPIEVFKDGTIHTHPFHLTIGRIAGA
jgi:hypothetical protein